MKFIKKYYKYILMFFFFFFIIFIYNYQNTRYDTMWNYGFSHAIKMDEVVYRDFNTISTPLYSFIMSLGLFIWDDFIVFLIEHTILVTILFYMIFRMYGKKGWLLLPTLTLPFFLSLNATYNFFAFFLLVLVILLEKEDKSDYLIGVILGLTILSKHTVGGVVFLLSLISTFNFSKIKKRVIGSFIPLSIFLLYLIITNSFFNFIDLCVLGLFDFGSNNHYTSRFLLLLSIVMIIVLIRNIIKNPKDKYNYYALSSFAFCIPLLDFHHFGLFLSIFTLTIIDKIKLSGNYIRNMSFLLVTLVLFMYALMIPDKFNNLTFMNKNHIKYYILNKEDKKHINKIVNKYIEYDNSIMVDDNAIIYDLMADRKITYFDVLLTGNYGYNGTSKMINKISKMHNKYFFIDRKKYLILDSKEQFDAEIVKYVVDNCEKVDSVSAFDIYYKE